MDRQGKIRISNYAGSRSCRDAGHAEATRPNPLTQG
jgi:hypothetical protein